MVSSIPRKIVGIDLPTTDSTWRVLLENAFDDLIRIADNRIILMLWDEFPLMLHNLQRKEGDDSAIQLLDHLRALRLKHANHLRFLFTGSVGLHLVLRSLRKAGGTNDPVNDMLSLTVPPMGHQDTCDLAKALLKETAAAPSQIVALASQIANEVGGFPYYIHHVVDQLDQLRRKPTLREVSSAVENLIYDPHDPANLNYYVTRLSSYYADNERSLALIVLDSMAKHPSPIPVSELLNLCKHQNASLLDEQLRDVISILAEDHYIEPRRGAGGLEYAFRWQLIKKWWKETRK